MPIGSVTVSIVCVFNNISVRQECLDRSICDHIGSDTRVEYIPVDNIGQKYVSAGAALNHGASIAKNEVIIFVHQDVFIHSLETAITAAGMMKAEGFGVLGAVGIASDGKIVGRVRDRVVLIGDSVSTPTDVDSVDELLFMVPRDLVSREPLTESPNIAWHAYAVEYGLRVRRAGLRVGVARIPVTHNSSTTNLANLDIAHATVSELYPEMLPVQTTCGVLRERRFSRPRGKKFVSQRARLRRLRDSLAVRKVQAERVGSVILMDIRREVDDLIECSPGRKLVVLNNAGNGGRVQGNGVLEMKRRAGTVLLTEGNMADLPGLLENEVSGEWVLATGIGAEEVKTVPTVSECVVGFDIATGYWAVLGDSLARLPPSWRLKRAFRIFT